MKMLLGAFRLMLHIGFGVEVAAGGAAEPPHTTTTLTVGIQDATPNGIHPMLLAPLTSGVEAI
jgi:hypothetical protein